MSRSESDKICNTKKEKKKKTRQNFVIRFVLGILAILAILVTKAAVRD